MMENLLKALQRACTIEFSYRDDEMNFHVGWLWIVMLAAVIWWAFS